MLWARVIDEFSRFMKPCLPMAMVHADFVGMKKKTALTTNSHEQFTENKNWAKRNSILFDIGIPLDKVAIILRVCNKLNLRLSVKTKHVSNNPKFHGTTTLKISELFPALKFWFVFFFCWASVGVQNWNGPIGFIREIVRILDMTTIGAICGNFDTVHPYQILELDPWNSRNCDDSDCTK